MKVKIKCFKWNKKENLFQIVLWNWIFAIWYYSLWIKSLNLMFFTCGAFTFRNWQNVAARSRSVDTNLSFKLWSWGWFRSSIFPRFWWSWGLTCILFLFTQLRRDDCDFALFAWLISRWCHFFRFGYTLESVNIPIVSFNSLP